MEPSVKPRLAIHQLNSKTPTRDTTDFPSPHVDPPLLARLESKSAGKNPGPMEEHEEPILLAA